MREQNRQEQPYRLLGSRLKRMREKLQESLAEVSGAVEIDVELLSKIELGMEKPSEDILLLLISHFGVKEDEASQLWRMADYEKQLLAEEQNKPSVVVMQNDARIVYTDMIHATANQYGVVINFMQEAGPAGQPLIVSRVGMSKEHAKSLIDVLQRTLDATEPRALPAPETKADKQSKN